MRFRPAADPNSEDERILQEQLNAYEQEEEELLLNGTDDNKEDHGFPALILKQKEPYVLSSGDEDDEFLNDSAHARAGPSIDMYDDWRPQAGTSSRNNGYASTGRTSAYGPSTSDKGKKRGAAVLAGLANGGSYVDLPRASTSKTAAVGAGGLSEVMSKLEREISAIDEQIAALQASRAAVVADLNALKASTRRTQAAASSIPAPSAGPAAKKAKIDYGDSSKFKWANEMQRTLKKIFGIEKLRLCQEGVLNAVMDGRDAICIMPTGGGKSVCFQAPAVLSRGCTLVISPLISLMSDQVMHLREKGIEAVMITAATDRSEMKDIQERLLTPDGHGNRKGIKLCYVTPEKIVKSKTFSSLLSKMNQAGLLTRIAIDESHCCSQMGHDFRPDYKKLSQLRSFFPDVPIVALTATCGAAVLTDVIRILGLKGCTPGSTAEPDRTVFFSAPLYRANLHYSVVKKPSSAAAVITMMVEEILTKHKDQTGIVYCLSKADTEAVAKGLGEASEGKIRAGTYHAGMEDSVKQRIHESWRKGRIKVVCATIAFGMGIDAPDVRFVFHHSVSKSMEGYYQETGRAGRDGKDSDCVLYFRPADYSRLSSMAAEDTGGHKKLATMVDFATDLTTCRKLLFHTYFGDPAQVVTSYAAAAIPEPCGHCDNCLRLSSATTKSGTTSSDSEAESKATASISKEILSEKDVTVEAWKICKILEATDKRNGKITLSGVADLARGLGKGSFSRDQRLPNGKTEKVKETLDLEQICEGKIPLNNEVTELLVLKLLLKGFLAEEYVPSAYSTNTYITTHRAASTMRYTRFRTLGDLEKGIEKGDVPRFEISVLEKPGKAKKVKATGKRRASTAAASKKGKNKAKDEDAGNSESSDDDEPPKKKRQTASTKSNAQSKLPRDAKQDDLSDPLDEDIGDVASEDIDIDLPQAAQQSSERNDMDENGDDEDEEMFDVPLWKQRDNERKQRKSVARTGGAPSRTATNASRSAGTLEQVAATRKPSFGAAKVIDLGDDSD